MQDIVAVPPDRREVEDLIYLEASLLDRWQFDAWLELYESDSLYRIPTWRSNGEATTDVANELSYVHFDHASLSDYVMRMTSRHAHAFMPPPRATRMMTNLRITCDAEQAQANAAWLMHVTSVSGDEIFSGHVSYRLRRRSGGLGITAKEVVINNDRFPTGRFVLL